ncbi:hypothetical protein POM88_026255 [Heracleum sosnowskyi]|uniref:Uncharacterized protein n=1 Tax=Heracleum sosnowskyi TaxID=360622 RepID=A0AAD8I6M2_9APIA|nr:hypothetical protein POM88_026255 [Heracleum sosnowskyi]
MVEERKMLKRLCNNTRWNLHGELSGGTVADEEHGDPDAGTRTTGDREGFQGSYVRLMPLSSWNSRTSSWTLSVNVPQPIIHESCQARYLTRKLRHNSELKCWYMMIESMWKGKALQILLACLKAPLKEYAL